MLTVLEVALKEPVDKVVPSGAPKSRFLKKFG